VKICLIALYSPYGDNPFTRLADILSIFKPLTDEVVLIAPNLPETVKHFNRVRPINIKHTNHLHRMPSRVLRHLMVQLTISWHLLRVSQQIDLVFWGISAHMLTIPMLVTKLLRKQTVLYLSFKSTEVLTREFGAKGFLLPRIYQVLEKVSYALCDIIVANSTDILDQPQLIKYKRKAYPVACPIRFIDTSLFKITRPMTQRPKRVGFIGRLSEEKGVLNLIKAIPLVLEQHNDIEFSIIGDGRQSEEMKETIARDHLANRVKTIGWLPHAELPRYLNEMQLLVLPSFTEGLPTIALEAMACGTPLLATPVGGVPELITDGETGFIMADNSPQTIAQGIIRALSYPGLEEIVSNAHSLIDKEYIYEATVERFKKLFAQLNMV